MIIIILFINKYNATLYIWFLKAQQTSSAVFFLPILNLKICHRVITFLENFYSNVLPGPLPEGFLWMYSRSVHFIIQPASDLLYIALHISKSSRSADLSLLSQLLRQLVSSLVNICCQGGITKCTVH